MIGLGTKCGSNRAGVTQSPFGGAVRWGIVNHVEQRRIQLHQVLAETLAELRALDGAAPHAADPPAPPAQAEPTDDPRWLADELPLTEVAEMLGVLPDSMRWACRQEGRGRPPRGRCRRWFVNPAEMRERFAVRE